MNKNNKLNKAFTHTPKFGVTQKGGGFTLVETLVSISIFTVSILGLMSILASGISSANYAKNKMTAGYLAQEGIEYVRNIRDINVLYNVGGAQVGWSTFFSILPTSPSTTFYQTTSGFSSFTRTISRTVINSDEVKITSTITWNQGSSTKSVILTENLFNWIE